MPSRNPYRSQTPEGWNPSSEPPPMGSRVEIQNNWGIRPWYGLYDYTERGWCAANDCDRCVEAGPHLSWRWPTTAENSYPDTYVDPTRGEQDTPGYWLEAVPVAPDYQRFTAGPLARPTDIPPSETPPEAAEMDFPIEQPTRVSEGKLLLRSFLDSLFSRPGRPR